MKTIAKVIALATLIMMSACARKPLDGAVYVIKGSGEVTRAAAIDVSVLPFPTEEEFSRARSEWIEDADQITLSTYQKRICEALPAKSSSLLKIKLDNAGQFSPSCAIERNEKDLLEAESLMPADLKTKISQKETEKSRLVTKIINSSKKKANNGVGIRYAYEEGGFGEVRITNNTDYWLVTGLSENSATLAGFVDGILVTSCFRDRPKIAPKGTYTVNLGNCSSEKKIFNTLVTEKDAKICREGKYDYHTPCYDDFGISEFNLSAVENYQKGKWIFANRTVEETRLDPIIKYTEVDFNALAVSTPEIKKLDDELKTVRTLDDCENVNEQITGLNQLRCPELAAGRDELTKFLNNASALGIALEQIPSPSALDISGFARLKATEVVRTNIEGLFTISNPPKGSFLLHAVYRDNFNEIEWLMPVSGDLNSIELNNSNSR